MVRRIALLASIGTAALGLGCGLRVASLGGGGGAADPAYETTAAVPAVQRTPRLSLATTKPVDAYVILGGRIKSCWFNPTDPLLPDHVYKADVSPNGSKVQITIHQKLNLGRPGISTYAIDFRQEGAATVVTTENRKMPPELAAKMEYDIERWKRGETDCNKVMPVAATGQPDQ